jgi:Protein of unknown function (DUF1488)
MPVSTSLPKTYVPYQRIELCGNELIGPKFMIQMGVNIPILVGKGESDYPRVWLSGPFGPGRSWVEVLADNRVLRDVYDRKVIVVLEHSQRTNVLVRLTGVVVAQHFSDDTVMIPNLDLRPLGLNIHGSEVNGLTVGHNSFKENKFHGGEAAIEVDDEPAIPLFRGTPAQSFRDDARWNSERDTVDFTLEVRDDNGTHLIPCRVSWEALTDAARSSDSPSAAKALQLYKKSRDAVHDVVNIRLKAGAFESDGSLLVRTSDLAR